MGRISARECQVVRILDLDGTLLTAATVGHLDDDEGTIALAEVDEHGVLIDYYFGRGERVVIVEGDGMTQEGMLDTCWRSADRAWWIGLSPPRTAQPRAPVAGREPVPVGEEPLPREEVPPGTRVPVPLTR